MIGEWQSTIARPDLADWVTVVAYLIAAFLSLRAAGYAAHHDRARDHRFWQSATAVLVLLALNELMDLQTLLTSVARAHAKANGWYEDRRGVQYAFVAALGSAGLLVGIALGWLTMRMRLAVRLALAGFVFIGLFVLLRAASLNHLDEILGSGPAVFNWGSMQETAGILIVAIAAVIYASGRVRTG